MVRQKLSGKQTVITEKKKRKSFFRDFLEVVLPAFVIFLVVRAFFFEARWVPSPSMVPTINENDRFLENKIVFRFRDPRRGEIIVFHPPAGAVAGTPIREDFVKRVIGLPGETIDIRVGKVYLLTKNAPQGRLLPEPYIPSDEMDYLSFGPYKIPPGQYFVMGDNRRQSRDGRYWSSPFLPRRNVDGKAFWRFWPLNRISILR